MSAFDSIGFDFLLFLIGGALVVAALRGAGWVLGVLPMKKEQRAIVRRSTPIVGTAVLLAYVLFGVRVLFREQPAALPIVLGLVVFGFLAASFQAARDFLAGVALKAGRVCDEGDHVRIGELEGRISHMGYRVLVLQTTAGDEAILPFSQIAQGAIVRTRSRGGLSPHKFRMALPVGTPYAEARARISEAALLCHWSTHVKPPEVAPLSSTEVEVTVFSLDPSRGPEIEARVKRGALTASRAASAASAQPRLDS